MDKKEFWITVAIAAVGGAIPLIWPDKAIVGYVLLVFAAVVLLSLWIPPWVRKWKISRRPRWELRFTLYPGGRGAWTVLAGEFYNHPGRKSTPIHGVTASVEIREEGTNHVVSREDNARLFVKSDSNLYSFGEHPRIVETFVPQEQPLVFGVVEQINPEGLVQTTGGRNNLTRRYYEAVARVAWSTGVVEGTCKFEFTPKASSLRWRE